MLCYRCEHRARFFEAKHRPRLECGEVATSKSACYMYQPCRPIVIQKLDKKDVRPWPASGLFAARSEAVELYTQGQLYSARVPRGIVILWGIGGKKN